LADELDMANEKATALEREMQALRARLKEAERNARDGVLSLQVCCRGMYDLAVASPIASAIGQNNFLCPGI
jgi:hypothetical protein